MCLPVYLFCDPLIVACFVIYRVISFIVFPLQSVAFGVINYVRLRKYAKLYHLFNFSAQRTQSFFLIRLLCVKLLNNFER